ncbi:MAG: ATP-binding cassette domain-containing protein [Bacteroidota bacterium]
MIEIQIQKRLDSAEGSMLLEVAFNIKKGQMVALYGGSGAGKTSLLRIIGGLLQPDKGKVKVNDEVWFQSEPKVVIRKPQARSIGFVFQDYALFPHMTVLENLEFASVNEGNRDLDHLLELTELGDLKHKKPKTLSGGQQQRVALARALAQKPDILLLDEPLSALDDTIRRRLQHYLLKAHKAFGLTTILVSHNIEEIIKLSDWAIELDRGQIVQQGKPTELFSSKGIDENFKVTAEVLAMKPKDQGFEVRLLVQNHVFTRTLSKSEGESLRKGDRVILASNEFNPKLYKE